MLRTLGSWLAAVTAISRAVNAAVPLSSILNDIADQAHHLIGFDSCAILLIDDARETVEIAGSSGLQADYVDLVRNERTLFADFSGPSLHLPAGLAYREGRTVTVVDVSTSEYPRLGEFATAQGYRSLLATPLRDDGRISGVLVGYSVGPHTFDEVEIELAELLAEQTATAIQAARLRAAQELTISELTAANSELHRRRERLDWAERHHRKLMQLVLNDIGLDGLVAALSDLLGASVTVEDAAKLTLASAAPDTYLPPPRLADRVVSRQTVIDNNYQAIRIHGQPHPTWLMPVVLGADIVGRLWVVGTSDTPDIGELHLIERFALVVGMEVLKRRHIVEVQERLSANVMVDLLRSEGIAQPDAVLERASALGHDLTSPHWLAVCVPESLTLLGSVARSVRAHTEIEQALSGVHEKVVVVLIAGDQDPVAVIRRIQRRLREDFPQQSITFVLSPLVHALVEYAVSYQVAVKSAGLRSASGQDCLIDLREVPLTSLLLLAGPLPRHLSAFAEQLVGPLAAYDERRGADLVLTLQTWLRCAFSTATTAEALTLHVNTVSYRLTKIQQLLNCDLKMATTRLELQLALLVWDIQTADRASD